MNRVIVIIQIRRPIPIDYHSFCSTAEWETLLSCFHRQGTYTKVSIKNTSFMDSGVPSTACSHVPFTESDLKYGRATSRAFSSLRWKTAFVRANRSHCASWATPTFNTKVPPATLLNMLSATSHNFVRRGRKFWLIGAVMQRCVRGVVRKLFALSLCRFVWEDS